MCRKIADHFKASYWLMGLCGHLKISVVDGKLSFRAWGHGVKNASLKYVSLREPRALREGSSTFLGGGGTRKVDKYLRVIGREQETGPQVSRHLLEGLGKRMRERESDKGSRLCENSPLKEMPGVWRRWSVIECSLVLCCPLLWSRDGEEKSKG